MKYSIHHLLNITNLIFEIVLPDTYIILYIYMFMLYRNNNINKIYTMSLYMGYNFQSA